MRVCGIWLALILGGTCDATSAAGQAPKMTVTNWSSTVFHFFTSDKYCRYSAFQYGAVRYSGTPPTLPAHTLTPLHLHKRAQSHDCGLFFQFPTRMRKMRAMFKVMCSLCAQLGYRPSTTFLSSKKEIPKATTA